MRLSPLVLAASLLGLAACQDSPVMQATPSDAVNDLSKVTILKPEQYAANGIKPLPRAVKPLTIERDPCVPWYEGCEPYEPPPPQYASIDYYTHVYNESSAYNKQVRLHSRSESHANVYLTTLSVSYRSVGGCTGTPGQFDSDYFSGYGTPQYFLGERYATYSWGMSFKWAVYAQHYFKASPGYYITGYSNTVNFPTNNTLCV
jgi:hypothetical protein